MVRFIQLFLTMIYLAGLSFTNPAIAIPDQRFNFDLPAIQLDKAIFRIAETAAVQIFFLPEVAERTLTTTKIQGYYTVREALNVALENTGLIVVVNKQNTFIIKPASTNQLATVEKPVMSGVSNQEISASDLSATRFDEIVTIGTRRDGRTVTESMVPIDVFSLKNINSTGYVDMNDALRTVVPSFNVKRLSLNDGSSLVRPVTLRSSPADHILLLLNGKRRHRSSTVHIATGHATTSGSQGQDFNTLPPIALKSIEVLRDGAAAMYGSDAIAGVVNYSLKDAPEGGSISSHIGQYYQNGGRIIDLQANIGLPLTEKGFMNLSAGYTNQHNTTSGEVHAGAQAIRNMGIKEVPTPANTIGEPQYEAIKTAWNIGIPISDSVYAYLHGNYMHSNSEVGFFYRQSISAGGFEPHAVFENSRYEGSQAHPDNFDLTQIYPGGFRPDFGGQQRDFSTVFGLKDRGESDLFWDVSFHWGQNKVSYYIENTINASLGVLSPTSFKPGSLKQREYQANAEISYLVPVDCCHSDVIISAGLSYRDEAYTIGSGDSASYILGPLKDLPAGSNGFQGYSPDISGTFTSSSHAAYLDIETDITENWSVAFAGRYENYEAFGNNFSYRIASRYKAKNNFSIRGSISTGFRAPASGQLFGTSQTSQVTLDGDFLLDAVLVLDSEAARIFDAEPFQSETSFNVSAGFIASIKDGPVFTLDFYQILVDDRLFLVPEFDTTAEQRRQLEAIGYPNGGAVQQVRFFQNKLNSRVQGADFVTFYRHEWATNTQTDLNLAVNYNKQSLRTPIFEGIFTPEKRIEFEEGLPKWNGNFSINHQQGPFNIMLRGTYYGSWKRRSIDENLVFLKRNPAMIIDMQFTHRWPSGWEAHIGARNLLNKRPPRRESSFAAIGLSTDNHSVFGISGGYYYAGLSYEF